MSFDWFYIFLQFFVEKKISISDFLAVTSQREGNCINIVTQRVIYLYYIIIYVGIFARYVTNLLCNNIYFVILVNNNFFSVKASSQEELEKKTKSKYI